MGIYKFELKKIVTAPLVWVVFVIFIIFNIAYIKYNFDEGISLSIEYEIESIQDCGISLNGDLSGSLFYKENFWRLDEWESRFQQDTGHAMPYAPEEIYKAVGDILINGTVTEDIEFYERWYEYLGTFNQYYVHPESVYENFLLEENIPSDTAGRVRKIIDNKECNDLLPTGFHQSTFIQYLFILTAELFTLACVISALPLGKDSGNTQLIISSTKHGVNILVYKLLASLTVFIITAVILAASFFLRYQRYIN